MCQVGQHNGGALLLVLCQVIHLTATSSVMPDDCFGSLATSRHFNSPGAAFGQEPPRDVAIFISVAQCFDLPIGR